MASFSAQFGAVGPQGMAKKRNLWAPMVQQGAQAGLATRSVLAGKEQQRYEDEKSFQEGTLTESKRQADLKEAQWKKQFEADKTRWQKQYDTQKTQWEKDQTLARENYERSYQQRQEEMAMQASAANRGLDLQKKQNKWSTYLGFASTAASLFGGLGGWDAIGSLF